MQSEKVLSIRLYEMKERLPYPLADPSKFSTEDQIQLCQAVYNDVGDMFLWYATIDENTKTYVTFESVSHFDVIIDETGLIVSFFGDYMDTNDIYEELAHAIGEGILFPTSEVSLSGKTYGYTFELL
jgi:hypothetical protein